MLAHVAGVPVEELLPFLAVGGAGMVSAARAWFRERVERRRRGS